MGGIEGAALGDEIDGPDTEVVSDECAYERAGVRGEDVDAVIGESRNEPVGVKRDGGDHTAVGVEDWDPVRAQAPPTALPIDNCQAALVMN